jgi:hypothetical protein
MTKVLQLARSWFDTHRGTVTCDARSAYLAFFAGAYAVMAEAEKWCAEENSRGEKIGHTEDAEALSRYLHSLFLNQK